MNIKNKLANALFGISNDTFQNPEMIPNYGEDITNYLNSLGKQDYMKPLLNEPKETGLPLEQLKEGVLQGLNFGVPQIAEKQKILGIRTPKTGEEIDLARTGDFNQYPQTAKMAVNVLPRQGGFLKDLAQGYSENYAQKYEPENLEPSNKNFATRLGEGVGTAARFLDSALGRGLVAYGLSSAIGDENPLEQAFRAGVGRQKAVTKNKLYKKSLRDYGYTDKDFEGIRGNIDDDIYKNLASNVYKNKKLTQDTYNKLRGAYEKQLFVGSLSPEEYQIRMNALNQRMVDDAITLDAGNVSESNQTRNTNINEKLAPYKAIGYQMMPALRQEQINQGWAKINQDERKMTQPMFRMTPTEKKMIIENKQTLGDIDRGLKLIDKNPEAYTFAKGVLPANVTNRLDPKGVATRTAIDNITAVYRKWLTGAQMSDAERKAYERFLPAPTDNYNIIKDKLQGMRDTIQDKNNVLLQTYGIDNGYQTVPQDNDPMQLFN